MKFSIAAISALVLSSAVTFTAADSYSDAMKSWCGGLAVTAPSASTVVVAGKNTKITVTRKADKRTKRITGLDLYSVSKSGKAKYVQNVWTGNYVLNSKATITDQVPKNVPAGLYYYRVWVTNMIDGQHGPDCLETSRTFKVTTGSHTNAAGETEYAESLHDNSIYNEEHQEGCFALSVVASGPFQQSKFARIVINRSDTSQVGELTKVSLFKGDDLVEDVWTGKEGLLDVFTVMDQLSVSNLDTNADYHYKIYTTSTKSASTCSFGSNTFKIEN